MDKNKLKELAEDIAALLKEYQVPAEVFSLSIRVPREYYLSIKENFPERHPADLIITSGEENWGIQIMYSLLSPS